MPLFFTILALYSTSLWAQNPSYTIHVSGHVHDEFGAPIVGATVAIFTDSTGGLMYYHEVTTDATGYYEDTFEVSASLSQGTVFVALWDCPLDPSGNQNLSLLSWSVNHTMLTADFICPQTSPCSVMIHYQPDSTGMVATLTAVATGIAPLHYLWSNGQINPTTSVSGPGTWCVTVTDSVDCVATDCYTIPDSSTCGVVVEILSDHLAATAWGAAPITYTWSDGSMGHSLMPDSTGTYCLTITDTDGCSADTCVWFEISNNDTCNAEVTITVAQAGTWLAVQETGTHPPITYLWSTGSTNPHIPIDPAINSYCVTITDAMGCSASDCINLDSTECSATITSMPHNGTITAIPTGIAPFTFLWSTGEITEAISPTQAGTYCVTITDAVGCTATACHQIDTLPECQVHIADSTSTTGLLWAWAEGGTHPYSFKWISPAGQTHLGASVWPDTSGTWCVVMIDSLGCTDSACLEVELTPMSCADMSVHVADSTSAGQPYFAWIEGGTPPYSIHWISPVGTVYTGPHLWPDTPGIWHVIATDVFGCVDTTAFEVDMECGVHISVVQHQGALWLKAIPWGTHPFSYVWSTGDTTQSIPFSPQITVSVTITDASGCSSTAHITTTTPQIDFNISGWVYSADSISPWPLPITGIAELWQVNSTTMPPTLVDTTALGWALNAPFYDFGTHAQGHYLVRIIPADTAFLPTYYFSALEWQDAIDIVLPTYGPAISYDVMLVAQVPLTGPGQISGLAQTDDGWQDHGEPEASNPLTGLTILLYDHNGLPLQWRPTEADGTFHFTNLPWGTYELVLERTGYDQVRQWVTLSPDHPQVQVVFTISEDGATVTGTSQIQQDASTLQLQLVPNPTTTDTYLKLHSELATDIYLRLYDSTGQLLWQNEADAATTTWRIPTAHLPKGIYLIQVVSDRGMRTLRLAKQ